ncbi:IclR family transcriptional regulator [Microvirga sp. BT688]|uniref:IclR family transcriptional regulator n=1 Tax=Microvirga sp. TaxID=1873136 RepID=UPI0016836787|nr:IclR family transcriptional regulator [Microvirga sp.]MBD2749526.1 IclR family transcriptional regulator [Microvirga sp.]
MMRKRKDSVVATATLADDQDPRFVTALARGLSVLRAFRRGDIGLGNQELADRTGLAKSTISRLTYTLSRLGYLEYSPVTGRYSLSVSALALGFTALGGIAVRDVARPMMQELADRVGCSVAIGAPDGRTMVYIEHCRGSSPLHIGIEVGSHIRMATSAMGRAYLASLDPAARERLLEELCFPDEAGQSIREGVQRSVEQYRQNGYVTSVGEWKQEVNSVGVPLVLHGAQTYALNCGGSALILQTDMLDTVGRDLVELATRIRRALGSV